MNVRWEQITYDHLINIEKAFELYDQAFPIEVREPHTIFMESLNYGKNREPNSFRFVVGYDGEQLVSFATGHYFAEANFGFIVYLATNPHVRNSGLGSKTLAKIEELLKIDAISAGNTSPRAIILETEKLELAHSPKDKEDCIKRTRFFERNGYKPLLGVNYLQPPLNNDEHYVPLHLLSNQTDLTKQEIADFVQVMYREKYDLVNRINKQVLSHCLDSMGLYKDN
ncbi:GNAT family N-acetyltransferase [Bacillus sp. PS06]|uniref:GNAT family N-acetyltransferase n=1 Tax=Bacillus sp. PS06 TaxID=2764176 RepID=UPI0017851EE4|nr:GNAT family N-acetyltransferase [Bacillus sp. PS06]MBD8071378.1 GNAT family N-acetyltransferase [Bacillus sp. PS06]